jgi:hypothetical protein
MSQRDFFVALDQLELVPASEADIADMVALLQELEAEASSLASGLAPAYPDRGALRCIACGGWWLREHVRPCACLRPARARRKR